MKSVYLIILCCCCLEVASAQVIGGRHVYNFLSLPNSARISALGGGAISVADSDLALAYQNPATLNSRMHQQINIAQSVHPAGITDGYAAFGYHIKSIPLTLHTGIQHLSYGKFQYATSAGDLTGATFSASDIALFAGVGYQASQHLSFGSNVKFIRSSIEEFNSVGWASDWAIMYQDTSRRIGVSLVLKNLGSQFTTYAKNKNFKSLPFDAQLAFTHQLKYLPLRFSIVTHHLHQWNVRYQDPDLEQDNSLLTETVVSEKPSIGEIVDNIFRHFRFNAELLLGKNEVVQLRVGYDRMRQGELGLRRLRTLAGFSAGIGLKVYKFRLNYGLISYHIAGTRHHFGISTNLTEF